MRARMPDHLEGRTLTWIREITGRDIPHAADLVDLVKRYPERLHDDVKIGDVIVWTEIEPPYSGHHGNVGLVLNVVRDGTFGSFLWSDGRYVQIGVGRLPKAFR